MSSIKIIESSNKKSNSYNNSKSVQNSKWDIPVNIDVKVGDTIMIDSTILNLKGISGDETVSILGNNNTNGLADSKMMLRFTSYVNDNAMNTVHLPFCGSNREVIYPLIVSDDGASTSAFPELGYIGTLEYDGADNTNLNNYMSFDFVAPSTYGTTGDTAPFNAGEINPLNNGNNMYRFSYNPPKDARTEQIVSPFNNNLYTIWTEPGSWRSITGKKYTLLNENYMGPYRKDEHGGFYDDNEELQPQYFDIKIDLGGEMFETPSTIANTINDQLNTSDEYSLNSPVVLDSLSQYQKLPTITGPLLKVRNVNGEAGKNDVTGRQSLYGNMAVLDLKHWQGVHRLMRCDLAFEYRVNFNQLTDYKLMYQPVFLMPNGSMNNQLYYPYCEKDFSLKYKPVQFDSTNNDPVTKHAYYSTLPKYFLMCTNISYTEANIQRIQAYMRNTEVYDGISSDDNADDDVTNWRSHWNIGISQQSQFKNGNRYLYFCSQGNYNITDQLGPPDDQVYAYSFPYYPFDGMFDKMATSRSDIPDVGYTQMWAGNNNMQEIKQDLYVVTEMVDDSQIHRFKDNKNKDASIAFFSKYQSDWRQNVTYDGYDLDGFSLGDDDSLSQKYNVMVVPVNMKGSKASNYSIDIKNTFWIGACTTFYLPNFFNNPDQQFMYKITEGQDGDHISHGGLSLYQYYNNNWNVIDECYIYSFVNSMIKPGRNAVNGLTYDGKYTVDLTTQHNVFVVDCGNTRRQVIVFPDVDDLSRCKVYYCDGYDYQKVGGVNEFSPLGGAPIPINNAYREVHLTDMYVGSSNSSSHAYMPVSGVNNNNPIKHMITTNPIEQVCGFMLYSDSATQNSNGDWDINTDFALPILHQGQFCVSASFMDPRNEAVWLTNDERYDTVNTEPSNLDSYKIDSSLVNNYLQVGTNNPTFQYNNSLSRCGFSNLHTAKRMGILDMPYDPTTGQYAPDDSMGDLVVKLQDSVVKNVYLYNTLYAFAMKTINADDFQSYNNSGNNFNTGLNYSIGGISFHSLYGESIDDNAQNVSDMTLYTADNWTGSLLNKLGFAYSDFFTKFGMPDNIYDSSIANSNNPAYRYQKVSPLTTNPLIDISNSISLGTQDYTKKGEGGASLPLYNLSIGSLIPTTFDGSTSEIISASDLPAKSDSPFYKIYSSLSTDEYYSDGSQFQVASICTKKYVTGDYVYDDGGRPMTITFPMKITNITTEIRDSQGNLTALDSDNYVFYKIISND